MTKRKKADSNAAQNALKKVGTTGNLMSKSNFSQFYQHQDAESHYISFIYEYSYVDIHYIHDINRNEFKQGNFIKLSKSIKHAKEAIKFSKPNSNK